MCPNIIYALYIITVTRIRPCIFRSSCLIKNTKSPVAGCLLSGSYTHPPTHTQLCIKCIYTQYLHKLCDVPPQTIHTPIRISQSVCFQYIFENILSL